MDCTLGNVQSMKILLVGAGGVGSAIAVAASRRSFFATMLVTDIDATRAQRAAQRTADDRISGAALDASDADAIAACARSIGADVVVNACDPRFNESIFAGAFAAGCHYVDMAMTLSTPHPQRPHELPGVMLGDHQFERATDWESRGQQIGRAHV